MDSRFHVPGLAEFNYTFEPLVGFFFILKQNCDLLLGDLGELYSFNDAYFIMVMQQAA